MSLCAKCQTPLTVDISPYDEEDDEMNTDAPTASSSTQPVESANTVPDDVHLSCGDHFHWECLLDSYEYSQCPHCSQSIVTQDSTGREKIIVDLNNEGGLQEQIDIAPILREESYLRAYPEERKCRACLLYTSPSPRD